MSDPKQSGASAAELLVVAAIVVVGAAMAAPQLRASSEQAHLLGAGRKFASEFALARARATAQNRFVAIRFEAQAGDGWRYSVYADGDRDGVRSADIVSGIDPRIAGPFLLTAGAPGVSVAIHPGVPEIPPASGTVDPADPIKFGNANMVSFSPFGTATPGTFYLAGESGTQAAVRVTPGTGRVRLMILRGTKWYQP